MTADRTSCRPKRHLPRSARRVLMVLLVAAAAGGLVLADRLGAFGWAPRPDGEKYHLRTFRVVRVIDGDTLDVDVPDGKWPATRIRLWGVDTPETVHPDRPREHFGSEATAFTRRVADGREVKLELLPTRTRGNHGRLLAYVYLPGGNMLNELLIEGGYGYADPRFDHPRKRRFRRLQNAARDARAGLWAEATRRDLPYYYRRLRLPDGTADANARGR